MLDVSKYTWKYLRETEDRYFDPNRNTSLKSYLEVIFPGVSFKYNCILSKEEVTIKCPTLKWRRYRPDAVSDELMLVVEFDGFPHYQDTQVVFSDKLRDVYFQQLGYRVVRIPYWIQLSNTNIWYYFGKHIEQPMCELEYSFTDCFEPLSACPGNMCEAGRARFLQEFNALPHDTQDIVRKDLRQLLDNYSPTLHDNVVYVVPEGIQIALNL